MENRCSVIGETFDQALRNVREADRVVFGAVLMRVLEKSQYYEGIFRKAYEKSILSEAEFQFLLCVLRKKNLHICDEKSVSASFVVWLTGTLLEESDFEKDALNSLGYLVPVEYVTRLLIEELFPQSSDRIN